MLNTHTKHFSLRVFLHVENISLCKNLKVLAPGWQITPPRLEKPSVSCKTPPYPLPYTVHPSQTNSTPRETLINLWCEFKTSKCHGEFIVSVNEASLIKTSLILAFPKQPLRWGKKGKNGKMHCASVDAPVRSWGSADPRVSAASSGVV